MSVIPKAQRRGRPPLPKGERKVFINVMVPPAMDYGIRKMGEHEDFESFSDYVRKTLQADLEKRGLA